MDVGEKPPTRRTASAGARVFVNRDTLVRIRDGGMKKGDVLAVAQVAGIMGAKRTAELIPMCHPVQVEGIDLALTLDEARCCVDIRAEVRCGGRTGVEMEALTAASTTARVASGVTSRGEKPVPPVVSTRFTRFSSAQALYLTHNGVVRETARASVREGAQSALVKGMRFSYNRARMDAAVAETRAMEGIYYVRAWLNEGELSPGDDIMYVLVGGDIRPRVIDALQFLVGRGS